MGYITTSDTIEAIITIEAKWSPYKTGEEISELLHDKRDFLSVKTHTNRSMWPDKEVVGVEIDRENPYLKGDITRGKIKISVLFTDKDEVKNSYDEMSQIIQQAGMNPPEFTEFHISHLYLGPEEESKYYSVDSSKITHYNSLGFKGVTIDGIPGSISEFKKYISVFFPEEQPAITEYSNIIEQLLSLDIIYEVEGDYNEVEDRLM